MDRLKRIWYLMRSRCNNPNGPSRFWYYNKGIKVCSEWNDFEKFKSWSLDNGYTDELTIDRIDSDKDYSPENCQWITRSENSKKAARRKVDSKSAVGGRYCVFMTAWDFYQILKTDLSYSEALIMIKEFNKPQYKHHVYVFGFDCGVPFYSFDRTDEISKKRLVKFQEYPYVN